ncbi:hypothetical protein WDU94_006568 [Cyamophila willieti]
MATKHYKKKALNKKASQARSKKNRKEKETSPKGKHYADNKDQYKARSSVNFQRNRTKYLEKFKSRYIKNKSKYKEKFAIRFKKNRLEHIRRQLRKILKRRKRVKPFALNGQKEKWINTLMRKLKPIGSFSSRRLKAESLVKWALKYRSIHLRSFKQTLKRLKTKSNNILTKLQDSESCSDSVEILGQTKHSAHTELFYLFPVYKVLPIDHIHTINDSGVIMSLFDVTGKKTWSCNPRVCNNEYDVDRMDAILSKISQTEQDTIHDLLKNFDLCNANYRSSNNLGHNIVCHTFECVSQLLYLRHLAPHYPSVREILTDFYGTRRAVLNIERVNSAIQNSTLPQLENISSNFKTKGQEFQLGTFTFQNEDDIILRYKKAFQDMTKKSQDLPIHPCLSCERLCYRRDTVEMAKMKKALEGSEWQKLMNYALAQNIPQEHICKNCLTKFRGNAMPASCIMNDLESPSVPLEISSLNNYEKLLIQRAKAFQTVVRMGSVSGQRRHQNLLQKVVGRTFHLPLPIEETLKKLPSPTEAILRHQELFVTIRGLPNKSKKIWQSNVDVKKLYAALRWLKDHNPLYKDINLRSESDIQHDIELLDNEDLLIHEEDEDNDQPENEDNGQADDGDDSRNDQPAILTQRNPDDEYYDQYTIQALEGSKANDTCTNLYQMLKVQGDPVDFKCTDLDLRCFPDLYPYGTNGQYVTRHVPVMPSEFIKNKILSKHERFRLNIQYIFHLFHETNIRALKAGIFHKLNIVGNTGNLSASKCLEMLKNMQLEGNLVTIFSRLRNSAQFWMKPRSDIATMITWYGPVTFFLTLSPSEYNWTDLGEYLRSVNPNADGKSTSALVATDPLSASRFIDNKFKAMLDFLQSEGQPLGKVLHYAWRREYQTRGLQHFHMLIWIKDAPVIGVSSNEEIAEFINEHITAHKPDHTSFPTLAERVSSYQTHYHNSYCKRLKKTNSGKFVSVCRFGFPRAVTKSLTLREVSQSIAGRRTLSKNRLYDLPREKTEVNINDYNAAILLAWNGNMDIQFIGEVSCAVSNYVTKYQTKAEKSNLGETFQVLNSLKSFQSNLWNIALRTLSSRECGVMEACDTLLGLSLFGTDKNTTIKWIDVNIIRSRKLKTKSAIEEMDGSDEDIFCPSMVDTHYPNRPEALEDTCLFDFVSKYDVVKIQPKSENVIFFDYPGVGFIKERPSPCLIKHKVFNVSLEPEKYFHSLLLLFKPWREFEELKGTRDTYADAFHESFDVIDSAMKHHDRLEYLRKSKEELAKAVEYAIQKEASAPSPEDQHLLLEAENAMCDLRAANDDEVNAEDLDSLISNLNEDQARIFNHIVVCLQNAESSPLRHFISGVGGTGKSYLIKTIKTYVKCNLGKDVAVTAPTGVAAHNIGGLTIHRLLQLPVEHGKTPEYRALSNDVLKIIRDNMKNVILLIIDEISMVSNVTLLYIHFRLTELFDTADKSDGWFGRIHILVFGDLLQLKPVLEQPPFMQVSQGTINKCVSCIGSIDFWRDLFTYDELTINVRQNKDPDFGNLLGRARIGALNENDVQLLCTRLINFTSKTIAARRVELAKYVLDQDKNCLVILSTRAHCKSLNGACLDQTPTPEIICIAEDSFDCAPGKKKKAQTKLDKLTKEDDASRTAGLEHQLILKQDCRVMLTRNFDVVTGLVNGSLGRVREFKYDPDGKLEFIQVQFCEQLHDVERTMSKFEVFPGAFIYRKQFPLTVAYAITIHKCQGISIESAILDIGQSIFTPGQSYVALSRVTTLNGLHLINFDPCKVRAAEDCIVEYNRLRQTFRQDLPGIPMVQSTFPSTKDVKWVEVTDKRIEDQEMVPPPNPHVAIKIPGFKNIDGVSCYANATVQALLSSKHIVQELMKLDGNPPLKALAAAYLSNVGTLSCHDLRTQIGAPFTAQQQQDASEFFLAILNEYDTLMTCLAVTLTTVVKCVRCSHEFQRQDEYHSSLSLCITSSTATIQQLLAKYQDWDELEGTTCSSCSSVGAQRQRIEIKSASQLLCISLKLWTIGGKITNFKLNSLPSSVVKINGSSYVLKSAIFHHGSAASSGHYKTVKKERN